MKKKRYDLAVAYRIYPLIPREPPFLKNDKLKLAELCLKSFKDSLSNLKAKIWVILDRCPPEYEDLFKQYFDEEDLVILKSDITHPERFRRGGNKGKRIRCRLY